MKKRSCRAWILTMAMLMSTCLLTVSCGKADIGEGEPVETDSITADTMATLTNKANSPACKVHIGFKYLKGQHARQLNQSLLHAGILVPDYLATTTLPPNKEALSYFLKCYVEDYQRDGRLILDQEPGNDGLNWMYRVNTDVRRYRKGIIAYMAHVHTFEGGQYPIDQTVVRNICEADGRILSIQDILVPGYDKTLLADVVKQLAEDYEVDDIEGLRSKGLFIGIEPYLPDNFILGDGAIQFIFQCDEIASHTLGEIRVTVGIGESELKIKTEE